MDGRAQRLGAGWRSIGLSSRQPLNVRSRSWASRISYASCAESEIWPLIRTPWDAQTAGLRGCVSYPSRHLSRALQRRVRSPGDSRSEGRPAKRRLSIIARARTCLRQRNPMASAPGGCPVRRADDSRVMLCDNAPVATVRKFNTAARIRIFPRACSDVRDDQVPSSKIARANRTARSTSSAVASGASATTWPIAGSSTPNVARSPAGTHAPATRISSARTPLHCSVNATTTPCSSLLGSRRRAGRRPYCLVSACSAYHPRIPG